MRLIDKQARLHCKKVGPPLALLLVRSRTTFDIRWTTTKSPKKLTAERVDVEFARAKYGMRPMFEHDLLGTADVAGSELFLRHCTIPSLRS